MLTIAGSPVTIGQAIHVSQLSKLIFSPSANALGNNLGSFEFQVRDDGGLGNSIVITNPSFESDALGAGAYTTNAISGWELVAGGRQRGAGNLNSNTEFAGVTATHGQQIAYNDLGTLRQVLNKNLEPNTRYKLQVDVGNALQIAALDTNFPGYRIELWAGDLFLSSTTQQEFPVLNGGFAKATVDYTSLPGVPSFPLEIRLVSLGYRTYFDNVKLTYAPIDGLSADTDPVARTFAFNIVNVNHAPVGTSAVRNIDENAIYRFSTSDFGFSDPIDLPKNKLKSEKIVELPNTLQGTLRLDGQPVTPNQEVLAASISLLTFTLTSNMFGSNLGLFRFRVRDDGGISNGGTDLDATARSFEFNIANMNHAPTLAAMHILSLITIKTMCRMAMQSSSLTTAHSHTTLL